MAATVHLLASVRDGRLQMPALLTMPCVSRALISAGDSATVGATSSALLFRAFTDSKEVPISTLNLEKGLRMLRAGVVWSRCVALTNQRKFS